MRISDWSSDLCSSDLDIEIVVAARIAETIALAADRQLRAVDLDLEPVERFLASSCDDRETVAPMHGDIVRTRDLDAAKAGQIEALRGDRADARGRPIPLGLPLGLLLVVRCRAVAARHERPLKDGHRPVTHSKSPSCGIYITHAAYDFPVQAIGIAPFRERECQYV